MRTLLTIIVLVALACVAQAGVTTYYPNSTDASGRYGADDNIPPSKNFDDGCDRNDDLSGAELSTIAADDANYFVTGGYACRAGGIRIKFKVTFPTAAGDFRFRGIQLLARAFKPR